MKKTARNILYKILTLTLVIFSVLSCNQQPPSLSIIISGNRAEDSIYITDLKTEKLIANLSRVPENKVTLVTLNYPTIGVIHANEHEFQTLLTEDKSLKIILNPDKIRTNNPGDSLLNLLRKSNLDSLNSHSSEIFNPKNKELTVKLVEKFQQQRDSIINSFANKLSFHEIKLLKARNSDLTYSFLFWYGLINLGLNLNDAYFKFAEKIDDKSPYAKQYPFVVLKKYEVDYLKTHDSISPLSSFLNFLSKETDNKDFADFLKMVYVKDLIEKENYWPYRRNLLNTKIIRQLKSSKQDNRYFYIAEPNINIYLRLHENKAAYNFSATDRDGKSYKLSDFLGNIVFIDTWATWCGPCIKGRPYILALAKKYATNPQVKILFISVDSTEKKWIDFLVKNPSDSEAYQLFIKNGLDTPFGKEYNIINIPRYILIDQNGNIINADIQDPEANAKRLIDELLQNQR